MEALVVEDIWSGSLGVLIGEIRGGKNKRSPRLEFFLKEKKKYTLKQYQHLSHTI